MKTYYPKKLVDGEKIGLTGKYVAVPDIDYNANIRYDGKPFKICYDGVLVGIKDWKEAKTYRTFGDRLNRGTYRLGYFKWTGGDKDEITK